MIQKTGAMIAPHNNSPQEKIHTRRWPPQWIVRVGQSGAKPQPAPEISRFNFHKHSTDDSRREQAAPSDSISRCAFAPA